MNFTTNSEFNVDNPEELLQLMGKSAWEFRQATKKLGQLEKEKNIRARATSAALILRDVSQIKNEYLKAHLVECFEDPKFKLTVDAVENFTYLENREIIEEYNYQEKEAKHAEKTFDMASKMLMWHQSKMKRDGVEAMLTSNMTP